MPFDFGSFFGGFGSSLLNALFSIFGNKSRERIAESTNQTNLKIAREANAASAQQANLAYIRNSAGSQLQQLMNAGLSKQGALNLISGAGSYDAAPITSANIEMPDVQTPQVANFADIISGAQSSARAWDMQQKQISMIDEQIQSMRDEERRKQDEHEQNMRAARIQNETNAYNRAARVAADDMYSLIKPYLNDSNYKDVSDLVKQHNLQDTEQWKKINTTSYSYLQDMCKSYIETSSGAATNVITWNKANRQDFYNSLEEIDKADKLLNNKKLMFEVEKMPELYEMTRLLQSGQLKKLYQDIRFEYESHGKDMSLKDLEIIARNQNIDLTRIQHYIDYERDAARRGERGFAGNVVEPIIDTLDLIINPLKGILSLVPK